ncbi:MAG: thiamine pyrophosphate enzyme, N-terminal TPP binding domain-containing protein [Monoraphidium minutum]|nr:MAG: thiamine pyrophosphate enzyme, N-terminal TPP binding domain-containing protein [Monoraphidium minutum]
MAALVTTAADAAIAAAHAEGIDVCFANPGTTEMWMVAALDKALGVRPVLGLHEAVCTGAADGYARMARRPALALLHLGAGLGNGLCNLHNARRARTPVVTIVGDMATWHRAADPVLNSDIEALAATQGRVFTIASPAAAAPTLAAAVRAAAAPAAAASEGGSVVTVVFPHDVSWQPAAAPPGGSGGSGTEQSGGGEAMMPAAGAAEGEAAAAAALESEGAREFIRGCAKALREAGARGKAAVLLGGRATLEEGGALRNAGLVAAAVGAHAYVEPLFARVDRGAGAPHLRRLAYFPQEAAAQLAGYDVILLVDTRRPVAPFGYDGGPSQLITLPDEAVWEIDAAWGVPQALALLAAEAGGGAVAPGVNCRGVFAAPARPPLPREGRLTAASLCAALAALQPEGAIIVDESLTSGSAYWDASKARAGGCPPFSHLTVTGGSIGCGPPMALGAALACPARRVINLQADGRAALWSQARERARVLTIICANSSYAILKVENMRQGVPVPAPAAAARGAPPPPPPPRPAGAASALLTSLGDPQIDWVALAAGMGVPGGRADSVGRLAELVREGLARDGPFLIMAVI